MMIPTIPSRLVTDKELELFQFCPAYLYHVRTKGRQLDSEYSDYYPLRRVIQYFFTTWMKDKRKPSLSSIRSRWDAIATRRLINQEDIIRGSKTLTGLWEDTEDRGLEIVAGATPIKIYFGDVVLQTISEAILVSPAQETIMICTGSELTTQEIMNNLLHRARFAALSIRLSSKIKMIHYHVCSTKTHEFSSEALVTNELLNNLEYMTKAIAAGVNIPMGFSRGCKESCPYIKDCYL